MHSPELNYKIGEELFNFSMDLIKKYWAQIIKDDASKGEILF